MTILVFGHCLLLKKEAGTTNVLASPLGQGERIKVRSLERPALLAPRETLTLPLSLHGRGGPHSAFHWPTNVK